MLVPDDNVRTADRSMEHVVGIQIGVAVLGENPGPFDKLLSEHCLGSHNHIVVVHKDLLDL